MLNTPLYFVRSGYFGINVQRLLYPGNETAYWSSVATSTSSKGQANPSAYDFYFYNGGTFPSNGPNLRFYGHSLHCLKVFINKSLSNFTEEKVS